MIKVEETFVDINEVIEQEVFNAYQLCLECMEHFDIAPQLTEIYEEFYMNVINNIEEAYERVFGAGSKIREDWLQDLGITMEGIPNILIVAKILNFFKLGYMYKDKLYNFMPQTLLRDEVIYDDGDPETYSY